MNTVANCVEKSFCFKILTTHICAEKPGGWTDFHSAALGLPVKTRGAFHKSTSILSHTPSTREQTAVMSNVSRVKCAGNAARIGADVSADGYICISEGRAFLRQRRRSDTNAKAVAGGKNNTTAALRRQRAPNVLQKSNYNF